MAKLSPIYADRPRAAHFEPGELGILVFGPGHGEAIVLVMPNGELGVVDGCRESHDTPVRAFLDDWHATHGRNELRFVALTHPHADHYAGLGRLIEAYEGRVGSVWHTALTGGHYGNAYLELEQENSDDVPGAEDLTGLPRVLNAIRNHRPVEHMQRGEYESLLLRHDIANRPSIEIHCVAPSHGDLNIAQEDLVRTLMRSIDNDEPARPRHDPNFTSAALLVTWGQTRALLGGDLLCGNGTYEGWNRAATGISGPVQVVKVAHHASEAAQDWGLWSRLKPELAIVTPFRHALHSHPPQPVPLQRIAKMTKLALTAPPAWADDESRPREVARPQPRSHGRSRALQPSIEPVSGHDAVCVSLDASGNIMKLLLTGRARLYR